MQEKTRKRLVWNKEFQMHQWEEYKTGKYTFTEDDKIAIVSEYIAGHIPASQIIEKYHISSRQVLFNWMDKYMNEKELVPLSGQTNSSNTMASKSPARITCTAILIAWSEEDVKTVLCRFRFEFDNQF